MQRLVKALGTIGAVLGILVGGALVILLIGWVLSGVEQRSAADEQAYFIEHGAEAVGTPERIVDQRSGGRYNRNAREYAMVYSFTRADGSSDEVRGPWIAFDFLLELELRDGTTATVLYLDDSAEHGGRAGQAVVLDETPE